MKRYLKYMAVMALSAGVASGSFSVKGQTSSGRITVRMPHGPVVMEIGRQQGLDRTSKIESRTQDKVANNPDKMKAPAAAPSAGSMPVNQEVAVAPTSTNSSGVIYDANEKVLKYGALTYRFSPVKSSTFRMGATEEQGDEAETLESPRHRVTLFTYWLGSTEVPQWLWKAVMNDNPSHNVGDENPVENVSWEDCRLFVEKLTELTGKNIGLPTEAQMELALRNGKNGNDNKYGTTWPLDDVAWYAENSGGCTHQVAQKKPNDLGLYDITGNVGEWCNDWLEEYPEGELQSPQGPDLGTKKVYRSAGFNSPAKDCRTSARFAQTPDYKSPDLGLRLVLK